MRDHVESIQQSGVRLVVIGNGQPEHARDFRESENITFDLWVDPEMKAYRAAGLRRGVTSVVSARSVGHAWRAMRGGFRQTAVQGDPWQNGGVFLITPQGLVLYEQRSQEAGDHAPIQDVLQAVRSIAPSSGESHFSAGIRV